jgi:hypothetical protein
MRLTPQTSAGLASLLLFPVAGCYREPALDECSQTKPCPTEQFPVCQEGFCFHHTFAYGKSVCSTATEAGPDEPGCCDLSGLGLAADPDCTIRTDTRPGARLSVPVATPNAGFVYVLSREGHPSELWSISAGVEDDWWAELKELPQAADPPQPVVNAAGDIVLAAGTKLLTFGEDGALPPYAGHWGTELPKPVSGLPAFCASGDLFLAVQEQLVWYGELGSQATLLLPVGKLAGPLGPAVDFGRRRMLVPIQEGAALAVVSIVAEPVPALRLEWTLGPDELGSALAGLALDRTGRAFVAARDGRLLSFPVGADGLGDANAFTMPASVLGPLAAGPVVREPGEALAAAAEGGVYAVTELNYLGPSLLEGTDDFLSVLPLRMGGVAGAVRLPSGQVGGDGGATGDAEESRLHFLVNAASLPGGSSDSAPVRLPLDRSCSSLSFSAAIRGGVQAVACDDTILLIVAPDYTPEEAEWPTRRGPWYSGCL